MGQVNNAVDIPWERDKVGDSIANFGSKVNYVAMPSICIQSLIKLCRNVMRTNVRINLLIVHANCFGTTRVVIPFIINYLLRSFGVPINCFHFRVLLNSVRTNNKRNCFRRRFLSQLRIGDDSSTFPFFDFNRKRVRNVCSKAVRLRGGGMVLIRPCTITCVSNRNLYVFPVNFTALCLQVMLIFIPHESILGIGRCEYQINIVVNVAIRNNVKENNRFNLRTKINRLCNMMSKDHYFLIFKRITTVDIPSANTYSNGQRRRSISRIRAPYSVGIYLNGSPCRKINMRVFQAVSPTSDSNCKTYLSRTREATNAKGNVSIIYYSSRHIGVLHMIDFTYLLLYYKATRRQTYRCGYTGSEVNFLREFTVGGCFTWEWEIF